MQCRVACIQLNSSDDLAHNLAQVETLLKQASAKAEFILLPENTFFMAAPKSEKREDFTPENHPGIALVCTQAKVLKIWVLIGSVALRVDDSGKRVNRSLLINAQGEIVAHYDKIHLFDVDLGGGEAYSESARIIAGGEAVVAQTPWGKLGMSVCYDVRFPQLYRALAKAGAEILAVPSAFTAITGQAHWHVLLRARAIEHGSFVLAPAQCGTHAGDRKTFGHALIVNPWGEVLADAGSEVGIVYATLDMEQIKDVRRKLPSLTHDREFVLKEY